jgi:hypothetical protein
VSELLHHSQRRQNGPTATRRASKARRTFAAEQAVKRHVLALDGYTCRWPNCDVPPYAYWGGLQAAHYKACGMGGNPDLSRCTLANLITICETHHTGRRGLHSPYARMEPRDQALGMRGPVAFYIRERREDDWTFFGETTPPITENGG